MDLLRSINIARFERIFCLGPKRNFYQKVVFWAEPNAIFLQLLVIWAFSAPKSANKRTLSCSLFALFKVILCHYLLIVFSFFFLFFPFFFSIKCPWFIYFKKKLEIDYYYYYFCGEDRNRLNCPWKWNFRPKCQIGDTWGRWGDSSTTARIN